jgi:hypothetical protein
MSRTFFASVLGASLALAVGCGSKSSPTLPNVPLDGGPAPDPVPPTSPTPNTDPKAEPPKVAAWELDQAKHAIPAAPVRGSIVGVGVTPAAQIEGAELTFRSFKADGTTIDRSVKLNLAPMLVAGQPLPQVLDRSWKVKLDDGPGPGVPEVWSEVAGKNPRVDSTHYALTLELGPRRDGKVAGRIFLSLSDEDKTFLAGTFEAAYVRPHTERPGPDDAPYIAGDVTVTGAKPDAAVRVTYAGFPSTGAFFIKEQQITFHQGPIEQASWTRDDDPADKPRMSVLVAGDGKGRPTRYEHVKLPPGRYLISAGVVGGPAAGRWVDVQAGDARTENFTLDATAAGGVEVTVPADVTGKVFLAPADAPDKPSLSKDKFDAIALQVVRQFPDIVAGKALIKNVAPGRYEVRVGEMRVGDMRVEKLRGTVEIVAGKTVELSLGPPKK